MKTITIYELLGMIKDGKLMPKRIKFENYIYIWRDTQKDYFCEQNNHSLESIIGEYLFNNLNLEVEILEEEKKIPEKICTNRIIDTKDILEFEMIQNKINAEYTYAINEIIDYLDYLKSKGDE